MDPIRIDRIARLPCRLFGSGCVSRASLATGVMIGSVYLTLCGAEKGAKKVRLSQNQDIRRVYRTKTEFGGRVQGGAGDGVYGCVAAQSRRRRVTASCRTSSFLQNVKRTSERPASVLS
ncbi:hypothetical protein GCM10010442_01840 [Kitasatospora kifunensis]